MPFYHNWPRKGSKPPWTIDDDKDFDPPFPATTSMGIGTPMESPANVFTSSPEDNGFNSISRGFPPFTQYPGPHSTVAVPSGPPAGPSSSTATWITKTNKTPYAETAPTLSPTLIATDEEASPSTTATEGSGGQYPDWQLARTHPNNGPIYAAAAIVPVFVLAVIGLVFFCLRKRKRQKQAAVPAQITTQEMKMRRQPTVQPYLVPPPAILPQYAALPDHLPTSTSPNAPPPIILGPIPSGANGAYLTGIDTSDVVSVTSHTNRPADPFSDNSLAEPPPPYRPRSAAPPSFVSASRQSSFRAPEPVPTTSQTHLIERSPFEDPRDADAISELSGPTLGREEDAGSVISDLSYQHDFVIGRSPL